MHFMVLVFGIGAERSLVSERLWNGDYQIKINHLKVFIVRGLLMIGNFEIKPRASEHSAACNEHSKISICRQME